jgi:cell division protein FtsZ
LLDNVSIGGSRGVLLNIAGGGDLTLGEVTQISDIVHDAAGDDAEIIFGAVHEPAMQGELRVTVIATGFDRSLQSGSTPTYDQPLHAKGSPIIPFPGARGVRPVPFTRSAGTNAADAARAPRPASVEKEKGKDRDKVANDLSDMEIPTFIRRQMD